MKLIEQSVNKFEDRSVGNFVFKKENEKRIDVFYFVNRFNKDLYEQSLVLLGICLPSQSYID